MIYPVLELVGEAPKSFRAIEYKGTPEYRGDCEVVATDQYYFYYKQMQRLRHVRTGRRVTCIEGMQTNTGKMTVSHILYSRKLQVFPQKEQNQRVCTRKETESKESR